MGLEAQKAAIETLARDRGAEVIATFTEVKSGKVNDRPELARALHLARITGATLTIAKLDRLSRNAAFLLMLRDSGVRFIAAYMPEANNLTVGIMAVVSDREREAIGHGFGLETQTELPLSIALDEAMMQFLRLSFRMLMSLPSGWLPLSTIFAPPASQLFGAYSPSRSSLKASRADEGGKASSAGPPEAEAIAGQLSNEAV